MYHGRDVDESYDSRKGNCGRYWANGVQSKLQQDKPESGQQGGKRGDGDEKEERWAVFAGALSQGSCNPPATAPGLQSSVRAEAIHLGGM